jgi:beta-glucosidase
MNNPINNDGFHFPKGFLWGSSISSHQVEGNNVNDWTEWETSEKRINELKKKGHLHKYGLDNFLSRQAANHFHLFKDDYQLAKDMGHNALRISLEWSRIEPVEGKFSEDALAHYQTMIRHLRALNIEPLVTLWHWTIPTWLRDRGGWTNRHTAQLFTRYVEHVVAFLKDDVTFWVTLNEPEIYASNSYLVGVWPPQKKNPWLYWRCIHNLIAGHNLAYTAIHAIQPTAQVGIAKNNIYFEPHRNLGINRLITKVVHWWWNDYFLNQIREHQDYIGLNYYFRNKIHFWGIKNDNHHTSDLGWELHPEGIYHVLTDLKKYNKPIYITENGLADATDQKRSWFIVQILKYVHQAGEEGANVKGYLHWSLIDNFEWDKGFYPRFGLVEVDYKTQTRRPRASAQLYAEIIAKNHLSRDHVDHHHKPY